MKLVASMPVRNELGRYLRQAVAHVLTYCDELCVLDDGSTDGSREWLEAQDRVSVSSIDNGWARAGGDENITRQALLEHVFEARPTHVLCIDADEFVPQGAALRERLERDRNVAAWTLRVVELWRADPPAIRIDGSWKPRNSPILYRVPKHRDRYWRAHRKRCACPREPEAISRLKRSKRIVPSGADLVHAGWVNQEQREERARRYMDFDRGEYHASAHIASILWPDERVRLEPYGAMPVALQ
jgi:glycosyltransferase involved in cell wall biosynthesis